MNDFFYKELPTELNGSQYIEINLMISFYQELKTEFDLNRWTDKEGFYYLLAAGLAALQNIRQLRSQSGNESMVIDQLQSERIQLYGRYAAMKHQVAELSEEVSHLEARLKATQSQLFTLLKHTPPTQT